MTTRSELQTKAATELTRLMTENPTFPVLPMVNEEVCAGGDEFAYWGGSLGQPEIDEIYNNDERIYFRSVDFDSLVDDEVERLESDPPEAGLSDDQLHELAKDEVNLFNWQKVITLKIELPQL